MKTMDALRAGIDTGNRNWYLVLMELGIVFINLVLVVALVLVPFIVALVVAGASVAIDSSFFQHMPDASQLMAKSVGVIIVLVLGVMAYLLSATVLWVLYLAGAVESIALGTASPEARFSLSVFLDGAKKRFWLMLRYVSVLGSLVALWFMMLGMAALVAAVGLGDSFFNTESALNIFMSTALLLSLGAGAFFGLAVGYMLYLQGLPHMLLEGKGAWEAVKAAYIALDEDTQALKLVSFCFGATLLLRFSVAAVGVLIHLLPGVGAVLGWPFQVAASGLIAYASIVAMAAVVSYHRNTKMPAPAAVISTAEDDWLSAFPESNQGQGTSPEEAPQQGQPPLEQAPPAEGQHPEAR